MKKSIHGYHAHIYFDDKTMAVAAALRQGLLDEHGHLIRVHGLISEPIGPHPLPMFEADIRPGELEKVLNWLLLNHGELSVLIHPITGNDLEDHRDHSLWLGKQLMLDLSIL